MSRDEARNRSRIEFIFFNLKPFQLEDFEFGIRVRYDRWSWSWSFPQDVSLEGVQKGCIHDFFKICFWGHSWYADTLGWILRLRDSFQRCLGIMRMSPTAQYICFVSYVVIAKLPVIIFDRIPAVHTAVLGLSAGNWFFYFSNQSGRLPNEGSLGSFDSTNWSTGIQFEALLVTGVLSWSDCVREEAPWKQSRSDDRFCFKFFKLITEMELAFLQEK